MTTPTPEAVAQALVAAIRREMERVGWRANDPMASDDYLGTLAALVASWVEPLEKNLTKIHGNYQPACPFCVEHRAWSAQALAALPWRKEEPLRNCGFYIYGPPAMCACGKCVVEPQDG
jgi:hypothetical protein